MTALAWSARLLVLLPALAALAGLLMVRGNRWRAMVLAVAGSALTVVAALVELVSSHGDRSVSGLRLLGGADAGQLRLDLALRADRLSAVVALAAAVVALCVQVYSVAYLADDRRYPAYAAEVSLFTAAMMLVVQADDLLLLLVGWEVMGLCSYLLVGHDSDRDAARRAAVKAFLVTRVGDVGFVLGIITAVAATRTSSITTLVSSARPEVGGWVWPTVLLLLVAGVAGKSAQFPLHTWLPDAMEGPTPVSALIHAATMVAAGAYVVARLLPLFDTSAAARDGLAGVACISMLGAALAAFAQVDLKRLLAYSTISQVAYMLAALAVAPPSVGAGPGIAHLLAHAGFKALLFLSAGALASLAGSTALADLAGGWRRAPLVAAVFSLGLAALAGLPPLSGYWSKEAVLGAAEEGARHGDVRAAAVVVLVVGILTSVVTAAYATRAWLLVVPASSGRPLHVWPSRARSEVDITGAQRALDGQAEPGVVEPDVVDPDAAEPDAVEQEPERVLPGAMRWPLVVLAVPTLFGGLAQVGGFLPGRLHLSWWTALLTPLLSLGAVALVVRRARTAPAGDVALALPARLRTVLLAGFGVDAVQQLLVVRPVQSLARLVVGGDRDVVDAYPRAGAVLAGWGGRLLRRAQTGAVTTYLIWLVGGVVAVGVAGVSLR